MLDVVLPEKTMNVSQTKQNLSQVINQVASGREDVVVEKNGLPAVAIIRADDFRQFKAYRQEQAQKRAHLEALLTRFSQAFADVPPEELEREVDKAVAEVRAERRAEATRRA